MEKAENVYPVIMIVGPDGKAIAETFLCKDSITIGRGEHNDIALLDAGMKVSREHLRLERRADEVYVSDLDSRNGTLWNGKKLESGRPQRLSTDDEVRVGDYILRIYISVSVNAEEKSENAACDTETMEHEILPASPTSVPARSKPYQLFPKEMPLAITASARIRREKLSRLVLDTEREPKVSRGFGWATFLLAAILLAAGLGWHMGWWKHAPSGEPAQREDPSPAIRVATVMMRTAEPEAILQGTGYVTARRQVVIKSPVEGQIEKITVAVGSEVAKDDVLARLDQSRAQVRLDLSRSDLKMAQISLQETEAKLREAERSCREKERLHQKNLVSDSDLQDARTQAEVLRAQKELSDELVLNARRRVDMAQIEMGNTLIRAPFSGVVIGKFCEVGEVVAKQGSALFSLVDRSGIGATIDVNENHLSKIFVRQAVELSLPAYSKRRYKGQVRNINPVVDKQKSTVAVDVAFAEPDSLLLPNMAVRASFQHESRSEASPPPILIPASALRRQGEESYVWIVSNSCAEKRAVTPGKAFGEQIEIVSGLGAGEEVIATSESDLREGARVRAARLDSRF